MALHAGLRDQAHCLMTGRFLQIAMRGEFHRAPFAIVALYVI